MLDSHIVGQICGMDLPSATTTYKNHRFPVEIISHAAWLYFRFCLSFRDVEELLFERSVIVTYEAIRKWCCTSGQHYATQLRRRRPRLGNKWHMDEVFLTIKGKPHYLWRTWIKKATSWTFSCNAGVTRGLRRSSSASSSNG